MTSMNDLPKAKVRPASNWSAIWVLPLIALLIAGTLKLDFLTDRLASFDVALPGALPAQALLDRLVPVNTIRGEEGLSLQGAPVEGIPFDRYWYEKVEDAFQGVQDYLKWIKRGMSRMTHLASIDIRNGRMTREEGLKLIGEYEGLRPASLDVFLKAIDMTEEEFNRIALTHVVAPHTGPDFSKVKRGPELPDQKEWTINIDIEESQKNNEK